MIGQSFAVDFDDTFTAAPQLWCAIMRIMRINGHDVYCVTARDNTESNLQEMIQSLPDYVKIVLCSGTPKREFCLSEGIEINVWIDDYPESIVGESSPLTAAYNEVERLHALVMECREQRDQAREDAIADVQSQVASLRADISKLKNIQESGLRLKSIMREKRLWMEIEPSTDEFFLLDADFCSYACGATLQELIVSFDEQQPSVSE